MLKVVRMFSFVRALFLLANTFPLISGYVAFRVHIVSLTRKWQQRLEIMHNNSE